jgi:hypothetical protein
VATDPHHYHNWEGEAHDDSGQRAFHSEALPDHGGDICDADVREHALGGWRRQFDSGTAASAALVEASA